MEKTASTAPRRRPRIVLTLIERRGTHGCHRGHRVGDTFDYDTERGKLCPMALHSGFPYIDILRYSWCRGGDDPSQAALQDRRAPHG